MLTGEQKVEREELIKNIIRSDLRLKQLNVVGELGLAGITEIRILHELFESKEGVRVGYLAERLKTSLPNVSRALTKMESEGKLERTTDSEDRRNTLVTITSVGLSRLRENYDKINWFMHCVLDRLDDVDLTEYLKLLQKFYEAFDDVLKCRKMGDNE